MEICQSCLTSFDDDTTKDVRFTIWEEVNRQWYLCPDCAAKLQDIVLGFMGEQGPADATTQPKKVPSYEESLENLAAKISKHEAEKQSWVPVVGMKNGTCSEQEDANNTVPHKFQVAKCPGYVQDKCEECIFRLEGVSKLHCKPDV